MRYLSRADVERLLPPHDCIAAIRHCDHFRVPLTHLRLGAELHLFDDPKRILGARIVRRDHHDVAETSRHHAHQRALRAIAISASAEHGNQTARCELAGRLEQITQRIVGVRVIDDHRDVIHWRRNQLETARNAGEQNAAALLRAGAADLRASALAGLRSLCSEIICLR